MNDNLHGWLRYSRLCSLHSVGTSAKCVATMVHYLTLVGSLPLTTNAVHSPRIRELEGFHHYTEFCAKQYYVHAVVVILWGGFILSQILFVVVAVGLTITITRAVKGNIV